VIEELYMTADERLQSQKALLAYFERQPIDIVRSGRIMPNPRRTAECEFHQRRVTELGEKVDVQD